MPTTSAYSTKYRPGSQSLEKLPANAQAYISRIEALIGAPVDVVSTGPDRVETIVLRHAFN